MQILRKNIITFENPFLYIVLYFALISDITILLFNMQSI